MKFSRLAALLYGPATRANDVWKAEGDFVRAITEGIGSMAGYKDGQFDAGRLVNNWLPYIITSGVTYGVQKLNGIIRRIL